MDFSGLFFICVLLPMILVGYFLLPDVGRRNIFLIIVSFVLYGLIQPVYALLLFLMARLNFTCARRIKAAEKKTVAIPILLNLLPMVLFRYIDPMLMIAGIGIDSRGLLLGLVSKVFMWINVSGIKLNVPESMVPVGYAFFTLSQISYLIDVYRGKYPSEKVFRNYLLYVMMFPKLFQGPVVRYDQVRIQIRQRKESDRVLFEGGMRFLTGLSKKVLIADFCGRMLMELSASGSDQALMGAWLRPVLFLFQIYYDFSAACDMAVGLGRIFGFRFPENFRIPFMAMSVTEFFEGWNLTVRDFFTDYVYHPMCRSRDGHGNKMIAGAAAIFMMTLWHGGSLNFWLLAAFVAIVLFVEQQTQEFISDLPFWLRHMLTFLVLIFCAVLFENRDSVAIAGALKAMIGEGGAAILGDGKRFLNAIPLIGLCWFGVSRQPRKLRIQWKTICGMNPKSKEKPVHPAMPMVYAISCAMYMLVMLWLCIVVRVGTAAVPSIFLGL